MEDNQGRRQFLKKGILAGICSVILPLNLRAKSLEEIPLAPANPTTQDLYGQGPFYTANAPEVQNNSLVEASEQGDHLILSGYVFDSDDASPIANAEIDIWHADDNGAYDNSGYHLRGKTYSDDTGHYSFETIKPGLYLNGSTYRPSHIHFKITPPNEASLITQLYFEDDPYIASDAAASVTQGSFNASERIIPLSLNSDGKYEGCWNIVFDIDEVVNGINHHHDKGVIYAISVNATDNSLLLKIGVFENAEIEIILYDMKGNNLGQIISDRFPSGKHELSSSKTSDFTPGIYLAQLIINKQQTLPLRFIIE